MRECEDLVEEAHERLSRQRHRLGLYRRFANAYHGLNEGGAGSAMDGTGRPILRMNDVRQDLQARSGAPNFISPVVDDYVALKGQLPVIKVAPADNTQESNDQALTRTRAVRSMWDTSNMVVQQQDAAWYLSCLGDAVYMLDPLLPKDADDLNPAGVYITVYNPDCCYPRHRTGRWREELQDIYIIYEIEAGSATADYGVDCQDRDEDGMVECILYYSRTEKRCLVDGRQAKYGNIEHGLGWVPGQWVRNKLVGGKFAQSDIAQAVDSAEELQSLFIVMADATIESVYAPIKVTDPDKIGGDLIEIGPRSVITVMPGGDVSRIEPVPEPRGAQHMMQTMQDALYHSTGTAPIRQGGSIDKSNTSGRAIRSVQGGMEDRLDLSHAAIGYHFERLVQKQLLMYHRIPELNSAMMTLTGSEKGKSYTVSFTGEEIGGAARVQVQWQQKLGATKHERLTMALQAYTQQLVPGSYVVEQLEPDDPEALLALAKLEAKEKMAQMAPPGGQAGGPSPGPPPQDPGQQANMLLGGSVSAGAQAPSPMGGPQGAAPSAPPGGAAPGAPAGGAPPGGAPPPGGGPGQGMPSFPAMAGQPNPSGMGPPPQTPEITTLIQAALDAIPEGRRSEIVGYPTPTEEGILIIVNDWKASSMVKKVFRQVGLKPVVKVMTGATMGDAGA